MTTCEYFPNPTRVWSRVQNPCTYTVPSLYLESYSPITNQTTSQAQANYEDKLLYKGNILQYKNNSSNLTKKQKYAQISKGLWCNRRKNFATQSQTYSNPNVSSLLRVNYNEIPFPNEIVGQPNNISGPYQYDVPNPFNCSSTSLHDNGNLICGSYVNPCSQVIIKEGKQNATQCFLNSCSNVPGKPIALCWNSKISTFFPRQRYIMTNSDNKFPQGYKTFVSAVKPNQLYKM